MSKHFFLKFTLVERQKSGFLENGERRCNRVGSSPQHFYLKGIFPEAEEVTEEYVGE